MADMIKEQRKRLKQALETLKWAREFGTEKEIDAAWRQVAQENEEMDFLLTCEKIEKDEI
jgi:hypothetical protein